ncbi:MAG: S41 family peptidase [Bacteroidales bacterium]|jgi:carboxyl-terminal processing protease|nr:S41 family peptidase [Bacteroidales bacterium]
MNNNVKNAKSKIILPIAIAISVILGVLIGKIIYKDKTFSSSFPFGSGGNKLDQIMKVIESNYVDDMSIDELEEIAIAKFLETLDPHTVYLNPLQAKAANEELDGNFEGIGIQFNIFKDTILVVNVIPKGPSEDAGLLAGDRIVKVNDSVVASIGIASDSVMKLLKGKGGTIVNLDVKRKNINDLIRFKVKRGNIPLNSIDALYLIDKNIAYVKILNFGKNTYLDFWQKLSVLKIEGAKSVVIDLRGNGGGYLDAAVNMIDEFFDGGKLIVYTEGKSTGKRVMKSTNSKKSFVDMNLVVLIDEFSASASEIFAGAIQDNDRGFIIGRRSFGKGLVQQVSDFDDGSVLRFTVSRYYTPAGRCIQKKYSSDRNEYDSDIINRFRHGEFSQQDSINFSDTTKYFTKNGRVVYAGGGIMPDIFVPSDTSNYSNLLVEINQKNLYYNYSLQFVDNNRDKLKNVKNVNALKSFLYSHNAYSLFWTYVKENNVKMKDSDLRISKNYIENLFCAYVARQVLSEDDFVKIINNDDVVLNQAIKVLRENRKLPNPH